MLYNTGENKKTAIVESKELVATRLAFITIDGWSVFRVTQLKTTFLNKVPCSVTGEGVQVSFGSRQMLIG
jgi:hypothetical protein